jgi:hypothetical protein
MPATTARSEAFRSFQYATAAAPSNAGKTTHSFQKKR